MPSKLSISFLVALSLCLSQFYIFSVQQRGYPDTEDLAMWSSDRYRRPTHRYPNHSLTSYQHVRVVLVRFKMGGGQLTQTDEREYRVLAILGSRSFQFSEPIFVAAHETPRLAITPNARTCYYPNKMVLLSSWYLV